MKLYYAPGACSLGIHVILEEIGKPYGLERVDLRTPTPERPLTAVNPKSKVPTLVRDDGSVLTEFPAVAYWLARTNPDARLFPDDLDAQARVLEATDYCVATLHMQGCGHLFRAKFAPTPDIAEAARAAGTPIVEKGLRLMATRLGEQQWIAGAYSFADAALYYVSHWASRVFEMALPAPLDGHFARMNARPAVQAALQQEGLA